MSIGHEAVETEPILGWRVWQFLPHRPGEFVTLRLNLTSVVLDRAWLTAVWAACAWPHLAELEAVCQGPPGPPHPHGPVPAPDCACGIWAFKDRQNAVDKVDAGGLLLPQEPGWPIVGQNVLGRVALWGRVIECEHGYRAGRAYPYEIEVPYFACFGGEERARDFAAQISSAYAVEARPLAWDQVAEGLEVRAAMVKASFNVVFSPAARQALATFQGRLMRPLPPPVPPPRPTPRRRFDWRLLPIPIACLFACLVAIVLLLRPRA